MNILGAIIQGEDIKGITQLRQVIENENLWLKFNLLTTYGPVEFSTDCIQHYVHATRQEQQYLQDFRLQYSALRAHISFLLGQGADEFESHQANVNHSFNTIATIHQQLQETISKSKSKNKPDQLELMSKLCMHIIVLKDLAEFYKEE